MARCLVTAGDRAARLPGAPAPPEAGAGGAGQARRRALRRQRNFRGVPGQRPRAGRSEPRPPTGVRGNVARSRPRPRCERIRCEPAGRVDRAVPRLQRRHSQAPRGPAVPPHGHSPYGGPGAPRVLACGGAGTRERGDAVQPLLPPRAPERGRLRGRAPADAHARCHSRCRIWSAAILFHAGETRGRTDAALRAASLRFARAAAVMAGGAPPPPPPPPPAGGPAPSTRILLREPRLEVRPEGIFRIRRRVAVQVLSARTDGIQSAAFGIGPWTRLKASRGWHPPPGGDVKKGRAGNSFEIADAESFVSDRGRRLVAMDGIERGSLVFFEFEASSEPYTLDHAEWFFDVGPMARAVLELEVPPLWSVRSAWPRRAAARARRTGQ